MEIYVEEHSSLIIVVLPVALHQVREKRMTPLTDPSNYIKALNARYSLGNSTEHTFRGDLQNLLESLALGTTATNEPKRQACGASAKVVKRQNR